MSRIPPLKPEDIPGSAELFAPVVQRMGFIPNSQLVMARKPAVLKAFINLTRAVYSQEEGSIPLELKNLIAAASSMAAGCRYCVAHTGSNAGRSGVAADKIAALWEFETSDKFTEAERAALRFAQAASTVPNMVTDADFAELRKHFTEFQMVEIVAVIAQFGFLNRWNDTLATTLEAEPLAFAEETLKDRGWSAGKHAPEAG